MTPTPDPYAKDLAAMKTASATPESTFEETLRADRLAALADEHRRLSAHSEARRAEVLRVAADRETYPIPNSYEADIQKLRERDARMLAAKESR